MNEYFKQNLASFSLNSISSESSMSSKANHSNSNENKYYQELSNHENFTENNITNKNAALFSIPKQSNGKLITYFYDEHSNYEKSLNFDKQNSFSNQFFMPNTNNNADQFSSYENQLIYCNSNQLKELNYINTSGTCFNYTNESQQISLHDSTQFNLKQFDQSNNSTNSLNKIRNMVLNQKNDACIDIKSQIIDSSFKSGQFLNTYQTHKAYENSNNLISPIPENNINFLNEDSKNEIFKHNDSNLDISSSESNKSGQMYPWMKRVHGNSSGIFFIKLNYIKSKSKLLSY
jgi:hypothetical protein